MDGAYCDGMPETRGDIVIGSDVWIGTDVTILSGINIEHGAIISAGSIVTRSVPPYAIIGGSPAKIIKYRYPADVVEKMLAIAWLDWEDSKIREAVPLLSSNDIQLFLKKYSPKDL